MAASDKPYRNQRALDIVFAVSSLLMLASIVWMFAQDYYRPYKTEQRAFRPVKVGVKQRQTVSTFISRAKFNAAKKAVEDAKKQFAKDEDKIDELTGKIAELEPKRAKKEAVFQGIQAEHNSQVSFYDIEVEHRSATSALAKALFEKIQKLKKDLRVAKAERDNVVVAIRELQRRQRALTEPLVTAQSNLNKLTTDLVSGIKSAFKDEWTIYDTIRGWPIIDGFADPIRIQQYTIEDIPIDYNFKYVTRFDRCTSCHMGVTDSANTREMLYSLIPPEQLPPEMRPKYRKIRGNLRVKLAEAKGLLEEIRATFEGLPELKKIPTVDKLYLTYLDKKYLTKERINQFCAHPRLHLFVSDNSPHPVEKFGCTSCHRGQGSGTEFSNSAHSPNSYAEMKRWKEKTAHGWNIDAQHYWDFPMLPMRFVEASCIKCHHEVTDLLSTDNRNEAPKLVRGYELIKENGCFGCHEIKGRKYNRPIGPDLRVEPTPALDELTAFEKNELLKNPDNAPGTLRKVGPSLYRLSEKAQRDWIARWIKSPRSFRPDTRMPHFYDLSNNRADALPPDQKKFPDAEIQAMTYYLLKESNHYLAEVKKYHHGKESGAKKEAPDDQARADRQFVSKYTLQPIDTIEDLSLDQKKELQAKLAAAKWRIRLRRAEPPVSDFSNGYQGDALKGRHLFSTKGCLACHRHEGTTKPLAEGFAENGMKKPIPQIISAAQHGPDLSQLKEKLRQKSASGASPRVWLMNWIKNPSSHSPRTKMPVVSMTDKEIVDVTAWLLGQTPANLGGDWNKVRVKEADDKTLFELAKVYLVRQISDDNLEKLASRQELPLSVLNALPADEQVLAKSVAAAKDASVAEEAIKYYVGKKSISRLGCFACHDIPGFDDAKPIGTGLNDWGKKDPSRLAFENIGKYVKKNYHFVDGLEKDITVKQGVKRVAKKVPHSFLTEHGKTKRPYEKFYYDKLKHHDRIGYLHQKILEPRSYDYKRKRAWDDRARMPQFRFARSIRKPGESDRDFAERQWKEEAEAREAVMTFVLGLVAEKVPIKSIYQPKGDRLAQVRGRKVIQQFNCQSCHLIRPGLYEFKLNDDTKARLQESLTNKSSLDSDFNFYDHHAWMAKGEKLTGSMLRVYGVPLRKRQNNSTDFQVSLDPLGGEKNLGLWLRLSSALRYGTRLDTAAKQAADKNGLPMIVPLEIRGGDLLKGISAANMIWPPPEVLQSGARFDRFNSRFGPFGGQFARQLTGYIIERDKTNFNRDLFGDNNWARASAPPSLIGQGGRTQPGWLYNFLLNPQPIRPVVKLRMPRFNMSPEEAQALVDYFSAVERLTNPRFGIGKGASPIPQQAAFDEDYWQKRTEEYVRRLKNTPGQEGGKNLYEERLQLLRPLWQKQAKNKKAELATAQKESAHYAAVLKKAEKELKDAQTAFNKSKTKDKKDGDPKLKSAADRLKIRKDFLDGQAKYWKRGVDLLEAAVKDSTLPKQQQQWEEKDAYVLDAFRLISDKSYCAKCHQIGDSVPETTEQGPPLNLTFKRLRPEFVKHWVARPSRMVHYPSPMVNNFQRNDPVSKNDQLFAGSAKEELQAATDVLMIYDRVVRMPIARDLIYYPSKKGDKK